MTIPGKTLETLDAQAENGQVMEEITSNNKRPAPRAKYRVQYVNQFGEIIQQKETESYEEGADLEASVDEQAVFEIISRYKITKQIHLGVEVTIKSTKPMRSMHIHSPAIVHVLRSVVHFYPSQDLSGDTTVIPYPFPVLVHHYDELLQYRESLAPGMDREVEMCEKDKDGYEDLGLLIKFLDNHIMPSVWEERKRREKRLGVSDMEWLRYRPGSIYLAWDRNNKSVPRIVDSVTGGSFDNSPQWNIKYWSLGFDGVMVGLKSGDQYMDQYEGEARDPDEWVFLDEQPDHEMVQTAASRGKMYFDLLHKHCKYYDGHTTVFPHRKIEGLVMVDMKAYYEQYPVNCPLLQYSLMDTPKTIPSCTCTVCSSRKESLNSRDTAINRLYGHDPNFPEEFDEDFYQLLPNSIHAYDFRTRTWELLPVEGFSEPKFEEAMIDNLVMDQKRLQTLKSLSRSFVRLNKHGKKSDKEPWSADFVKGKGNGLIFLLHGKPGVGKTCTAECIAQYTQRPLMVLTSSDIGTDPKVVEENLTQNFKQAYRWNAVLLIDEADVFMERRSTADLTRNSLVAGFLRALEFYQGILFLTTNRVGSFDDAFISRVHVQLYYPDFDDESRMLVWQTFVKKLAQERGDYMRLNIDAKEYIEGNEVRAVKWNGREIRNAFQTAVALAEYEAEKDKEGRIVVTDKHLKSVVELSRDFKDYLDNLHQGDEDTRAERRRERKDR